VPVRARAAAEITPDLNVPLGMPAFGSGGGYDGPLAYRMGKPTASIVRPGVSHRGSPDRLSARGAGGALAAAAAQAVTSSS
jgi:hypothetical protein